jgi:sodium/potassium-transporting ATPase subunit alpha
MDDDFCSIVNGIEEGRTLFDNLTKTIAYTLTHLVPELVAVIINIVFKIPAGMSTLMMLSIDLVTEVRKSISDGVGQKGWTDGQDQNQDLLS